MYSQTKNRYALEPSMFNLHIHKSYFLAYVPMHVCNGLGSKIISCFMIKMPSLFSLLGQFVFDAAGLLKEIGPHSLPDLLNR